MTASYRFVVSGRVQGVYFRQSTVTQARRLGLKGWVCNLADGRVEGVAAGDDETRLEALRKWLHSGPPAARVESVDWRPFDGAVSETFEVR